MNIRIGIEKLLIFYMLVIWGSIVIMIPIHFIGVSDEMAVYALFASVTVSCIYISVKGYTDKMHKILYEV